MKKKIVKALFKILAGDVIDFQKFKEKREKTLAPDKAQKIKPNPKRDAELAEKLIELLEKEHVDSCDSYTCDINFAYDESYEYWSIVLFDSSGAASEEFNNLYAQLSPAFFTKAEEERKQMITQPHTECPHCNAIIWGDDEAEYCDSCNKDPQEISEIQ